MYHPPASTDQAGGEYIELYNSQPWPVPLSGHRLAGGIAYTFPPSTTVPAFGFVVVAKSPSVVELTHKMEGVLGPYEGRLGDAQDTIRLLNPLGAVLLEVHYQDHAPWPEAADGSGYALTLRRPSYHEGDPRAWSAGRVMGGTPGRHEPTDLPDNTAAPIGSGHVEQSQEIVFNEVMFHPLGDNDADEYIELYNRSSESVDLAGWQLANGVRFEFPTGTQLAAGAYLVIGKDVDRLRTKYPQLNETNSIGNYRGQLSNRGETLHLVRPATRPSVDAAPETAARPKLLVDQFRYWDRTRTSRWADGGGSSLELVDPHSDNDFLIHWADSDESTKSQWTTLNITADMVATRGIARTFQILHLGPGEYLIDDLTLSVPGEENQIPDPGFDEGQGRWTFQGNHARSEVITQQDEERILHVKASGRGDPHSNRIQLNAPGMRFNTPGKVTVTARSRWLSGHPEVLFRFQQNKAEVLHALAIPETLGSPGLRNSRWISNAGPAIVHVRHTPPLPGPGEPVLVTARVSDPDGVHRVTLHVRQDDSDEEPTTKNMRDDGSGGDRVAGDGIYTAQIEGQAEGDLLAFRVEAVDHAPSPATQTFPRNDPGHECLIRFGDPAAPEGFGHYHVWYTRETLARWTDQSRTPASNEPLPVTFVYNGERISYDVQATYSGSFFNSPNYTSPTGTPCDYVIRFPSDERFLGATRVILSWPGLTGANDPTLQREQLAYWLGSQLGLPFNHRRYVSVYVDGRRRGALMEDTQRPNGDMVRQWFPEDDSGDLYKIQVRYESDSSGRRAVSSQSASLKLDLNEDGSKRVAGYRWNWAPQSDGPSANRFSPLFQLVDAVSFEDQQNYLKTVREEIDIEQWMRTFALQNLIGNWDSYGYGNGQNMYTYKPQDQGWQLMIWDLDIGLGSSVGEGPRTPLFRLGNPFFPTADGDREIIGRMYRTPEFQRAYYRALADATSGPFTEEAVSSFLLPRFESLSQTSERPRVTRPNSIIAFVRTRRQYVMDQLNRLKPDFEVHLPSSDVETTKPRLQISGTAPIKVHHIEINETPQSVEWTDVNEWQIEYPLRQQTQTLVIQGVDRLGEPIADLEHRRSVHYTGDPGLLPPTIRINEWMADNDAVLADPADGDFEDWIELYNPGTDPVDLADFTLTDDLSAPNKWQFPAGSFIAGRGFIIVWADGEPDQTGFEESLHASFRLNSDGETISLFQANGQLVDQISFGPQTANRSEGRFPDGSASTGHNPLPIPSPNQSNLSVGRPTINSWALSSPETLSLSWSSIPGEAYQIQTSDSLQASVWRDTGMPIEATDQTTTATLTVTTDVEQTYYRIITRAHPTP